MKYDEFVGQVQQRARLGTSGDAVKAIRATLETLGERLTRDEAKDLAAQLPEEIGRYVIQAESGSKFGIDEFFNRVLQKEGDGVDLPEAVFFRRAEQFLSLIIATDWMNGFPKKAPVHITGATLNAYFL
jgi:uncharacterized protein (DUF2267 family)